MLVARTEGIHELARQIFGDAENVVALIFSFERGAANAVNRLALLVHHIVVFEKVFAGVEVLRFDGFLGLLDTIRDHFRFDGHAFGHAEAVHKLLDALAAEDAHEVVFEGEEKARGTRVALAAGPSTQLVIDAACFVAFGAENVQAAESDHFVVLGFALLGELVVNRFPLVRRNLKNFSFVLEKHHLHGGLGIGVAVSGDHGGSGGVGHGQLVFQAIIACHLLGIAAEKNVRAAAGHVGGDGDGAFAAGLRDDARFALVLLGVEHFVGDAGPSQDFGNGFRFFNGDGSDEDGLAAFVVVANAVGERIVFLHDSVDHRFELFFFGAVDDVAVLFADQFAVRRE